MGPLSARSGSPIQCPIHTLDPVYKAHKTRFILTIPLLNRKESRLLFQIICCYAVACFSLEIYQGGAKWFEHSRFTRQIKGNTGPLTVSMPDGVYIFGIGGVTQFLPTGKKKWEPG